MICWKSTSYSLFSAPPHTTFLILFLSLSPSLFLSRGSGVSVLLNPEYTGKKHQKRIRIFLSKREKRSTEHLSSWLEARQEREGERERGIREERKYFWRCVRNWSNSDSLLDLTYFSFRFFFPPLFLSIFLFSSFSLSSLSIYWVHSHFFAEKAETA